jgi:ABC-type nitrate/sulfonate/bicarbonate transport system substrate-binding protein
MPTLSPDAPAQLTLEKITLRYTRCAAAPTTSSLAAQLDYFEDEFEDEPNVILSLASLSLDPKLNPSRAEQFSLRHAGVKSAWARAQGAPLRIVALSHLQSHYSLWTLRTSGLNAVTDLKDKRLGVPFSEGEETLDLTRAGSLHAYESALSLAGLTLDQTELIPVPTQKTHFDENDDPEARRQQHLAVNRELLSRLFRTEVDVITGNFTDAADVIGLNRIFDSRTVSNPAANRPSLRALVVHETLLKEKFDWVVRILARQLQAAAWAKANPSAAKRLVAQDHRTSVEALEARFPDLIGGLQIDLRPDKIESLRRQIDFYHRHGFIAKNFDADAWVDFRPLEAARKLASQRGF